MMLDLLHEINLLWNPVYPYLANHIYELYGRQDGRILDIGPFAGVIFDLQRKSIGNSFLIATFPPGMAKFFLQEAKKQNVEEKVDVLETDPFLTGVGEESVDLAIFRGAFFFPSLFEVNLPRIYRVLRPSGMAFIGGGFGKFTPEAVIQDIGKRSRGLNLKMGKIEVKENKLREDIRALHIKGKVEVITEGGLWVLMKKV
jgi:hypothetical protein